MFVDLDQRESLALYPGSLGFSFSFYYLSYFLAFFFMDHIDVKQLQSAAAAAAAAAAAYSSESR